MSFIKVNIYYKNHLSDSFIAEVSKKVHSIDDARYIVISHLDTFYSEVKYKLNLFRSFDENSEINLFFEEDLGLSRELKLKQILEND